MEGPVELEEQKDRPVLALFVFAIMVFIFTLVIHRAWTS